MRLDRASGRTVRQIAEERGLSPSTVHSVVRHVRIQLPNAWHRARLPKDEPFPYDWAIHRALAPRY